MVLGRPFVYRVLIVTHVASPGPLYTCAMVKRPVPLGLGEMVIRVVRMMPTEGATTIGHRRNSDHGSLAQAKLLGGHKFACYELQATARRLRPAALITGACLPINTGMDLKATLPSWRRLHGEIENHLPPNWKSMTSGLSGFPKVGSFEEASGCETSRRSIKGLEVACCWFQGDIKNSPRQTVDGRNPYPGRSHECPARNLKKSCWRVMKQ